MKDTQNTKTPIKFFEEVQNLLSIEITHDLAATKENSLCETCFTPEDDALCIDWPTEGWGWLNPPFRRLGDWVNKCHEQSQKGAKIVTIWPLSGDLNQIKTWENCQVNIVHGRVWPYVRGCMLCVWGRYVIPGVYGVRWKNQRLTRIW